MKYSAAEYAKYLMSLNDLPAEEQKNSIKKVAQLLLKNGDIKEAGKIFEVYESLKAKSAKKKTATVKYFGEIHKTKIQEQLADYEVEFEEDKKVKGGVQIQIGDIRIDNTLAGRLSEVRRSLM